jgi:hypothetical protein
MKMIRKMRGIWRENFQSLLGNSVVSKADSTLVDKLRVVSQHIGSTSNLFQEGKLVGPF